MEIQSHPPAHGDYSVVRAAVNNLREQIGQIIVGQEQMVELLMTALLARGHVLIEGYPGLAKTLTAKLLAKSIDAGFSRIQFTPDLMPSDLLGTHVYNVQTSSFTFRKGPLFSNLILIDEINRAPAKTQSALFEVMEERQVTLEGVRFAMEEPFLIIATQNPIDLEGTYPLPEAQMDRFLFKIKISYPTLDEEVLILRRHLDIRNMHELIDVKPTLAAYELKKFQDLLPSVHIEDQLLLFIADLVHRTRIHRDILIGGSPRASLALLYGSRALAMIRGRDFVIPEDVKDIAIPALNHRLVLTAEKEMEGGKVDDVIRQLLAQTEVPR
ncbi:MAG TPA: MoxR family ATPase [Saprospiraceae bacterium]|nr:MoxR family ATPase [Saprospiraceae bacterium]